MLESAATVCYITLVYVLDLSIEAERESKRLLSYDFIQSFYQKQQLSRLNKVDASNTLSWGFVNQDYGPTATMSNIHLLQNLSQYCR